MTQPAPRLAVDKLPPEWERMPQYLILPLEPEVRALRQALRECGQIDYQLDDFVNELLLYLRAQFIDLESLESFLLETKELFAEDAPRLIPALERLGKSLLRQLHLCGAYTSDGYLHYFALPQNRWIGLEPVLAREVVLGKPAQSSLGS